MAHNHPPLVWDLETSGIYIEIWILLSTCLRISHVPSPSHSPPHTPHWQLPRCHPYPWHRPQEAHPCSTWDISTRAKHMVLVLSTSSPPLPTTSHNDLSPLACRGRAGVTCPSTVPLHVQRHGGTTAVISTTSEPNIVIWFELWLAEAVTFAPEGAQV